MTKDSLKWFDKGRVLLTNRQKVIEGPVGAVTEAQLKALADVPVLAYAYYNGKLNGQAFGRSFWDSFDLNPDNNINKPVYGIKGREVLAGEAVNQENILEGIAAYQAGVDEVLLTVKGGKDASVCRTSWEGWQAEIWTPRHCDSKRAPAESPYENLSWYK